MLAHYYCLHFCLPPGGGWLNISRRLLSTHRKRPIAPPQMTQDRRRGMLISSGIVCWCTRTQPAAQGGAVGEGLGHPDGAERRAGAKLTEELRPYERSRCAEHGEDVAQSVRTPPGVVMFAPSEVPRNAERRQCEGRAASWVTSAAKGIIEAGVLHLASLQRRGPILREDCYNVVTRAPTVGNDLLVPDSKRERGDARYALLGTRSAGGGRCPSDCLGAVPVGPPLALAARCGPGLPH